MSDTRWIPRTGASDAELADAVRRIEGIRYAIGGTEETALHYRKACSAFMHLHYDRLLAVLSTPSEPAPLVGEDNDPSLTVEGFVPMFDFLREMNATPEQPVERDACDHGVPYRWACEICDTEMGKELPESTQPAQPEQVSGALPEPWRPINELPETDDLYWFMRGDAIDGPREPSAGGIDADYWDWFAPCEAPSRRLTPQQVSGEDGLRAASTSPSDVVAGTLAFFQSCIRSGEPWDDMCQQMYDKAIAENKVRRLSTGQVSGIEDILAAIQSEIDDYGKATLLPTEFDLIRRRLTTGQADKPFPAPGARFPLTVMGQPMREYQPGKWEYARWPSETRQADDAAEQPTLAIPAATPAMEAAAEAYRKKAGLDWNWAGAYAAMLAAATGKDTS